MPKEDLLEPDPTFLKSFQVIGLYNEFDYRIPVNTIDKITAIIAPNGAGKTLCLKIISSLYNKDWKFFLSIIFDAIRFEFTDGSILIVTKTDLGQKVEEYESIKTWLHLELTKGGDVFSTVAPDERMSRRGQSYERYLPFLRRISPMRWLDVRSDEVYREGDIVTRFADELPGGQREIVSQKNLREILDFLEPLKCTFIETQRLIVLSEEVDFDPEDEYIEGRHSKTIFTIEEKAKTLKRIISREMTKYAALSQSLDRSFPRRVIASSMGPIAPSDIQLELDLLDERRKQLVEVGILDSQDDTPVSMPSRTIDEALTDVLSVYIDDNKQKLSSLDDLYEKISLFKELMDARFGKKDIKITQSEGLDVFFGDTHIPIEKLSSGEQHQLVLFFSLLFEIPPNSLILIDEPEISLHIAWQKKFIGDLKQIVKLKNFSVILATHSPQLISLWDELVVELGDVYEGQRDEYGFYDGDFN